MLADQISQIQQTEPEESEPNSTEGLHCPTTEESKQFYQKHFKNSTPKDWSDWKWQLLNRITSVERLKEILGDEFVSSHSNEENLPLAITPYYASLLEQSPSIRKCVIPSVEELIHSPEEQQDPLGEDLQNPVPCIVHRYPDRVLFLSTKFCSVNCRFCTRARIVGEHISFDPTMREWERGFQYIKEHKEIRDVLVSGGDPLTMSNIKLDYLLSRLRTIDHIEIIRIGTKVPAVLPQRITPELLNVLKKYHPIFASLHFTHPIELTEETTYACNQMADSGIPLGSQTVLLKGINDDSLTLKKLFTGLLKMRVRPYILYQCDLILGSSHFRTPVSKGIEIIKSLRGFTSGYAIPSLIIDSPNSGGKIPILPNYIEGREGNDLILTNYEGKRFIYPDVFDGANP